VRLNVMRHIGGELQQLSNTFRKSQKDFLTRLRGQEEQSADFFKNIPPAGGGPGSSPSSALRGADLDAESKQPMTLEQALDRGLSPSQMQQLQAQARVASDRERDIIHIAQSINDLASIFKELSVLVIEQGTILDRIDFNVEQAMHNVKKGTAELVVANEYSKKARTIKCIIFLLFVVALLILILVLKKTQFGKSGN